MQRKDNEDRQLAERQQLLIRPAAEADFEAIAAIYRPYVLDTAITFEIEPPPAAEMHRRWQAITAAGAPYLVAEAGAAVRGYAFARPYGGKAAYAWTLENSIYVATGNRNKRIGAALMAALVAETTRRGYRQMVALISAPEGMQSLAFHTAHGFASKGRLAALGFKFGRWHDVIYMQRPLGEGGERPPGSLPGSGNS